MSTRNSPLRVLKAQADKIAQLLKAAERGEKLDVRFAEKIAEARTKSSVKVAVFMDDKGITLDLPWEAIRSTSEVGLAAYVLKLMREEREH